MIQIHLGDSREVLPTLNLVGVDAVIADPPFGIHGKFGHEQRRRGQGRRLQFDWDDEGTDKMVRHVLAKSFKCCSFLAGCFVFCGFETTKSYARAARSANFTVKPACWVKPYPPPAGKGCWWPSAFELAYYGYRGRGSYFGDQDPKRSNVFNFDTLRNGNGEKIGHPTQKPLELMLKIVESICPPRGLVLDPFMGSGTTGLACLMLGRRYVGIEREAEFFAMAKERLNQ